MNELFSVMLNVISPIMLVMGFGYIIGKLYNPDPRSLSVYLIYLFTPALVFRGIYETELPTGDLLGVGVVVIGVALVMMVIGYGAARLLGYTARQESSLILSIVLVNAANYGIPLNTFAFGQEGGNVAIVYYVISALVGNVLGVFFASRGSVSAREAILNVFKVPIMYAAILGLILNMNDIALPLVIERSVIDIAAPASIPLMLALLGLQLSRVSFKQDDSKNDDNSETLATNFRALGITTALRLLAAPVVAVGIALAVGLDGTTFNVSVMQSSMPTAVLAGALATQFGGDARFVSAVTLVSTLASIASLSILILLLGGTIA
ncbi:MAG: AEC family transporter [Chloroflexota bacterium]